MWHVISPVLGGGHVMSLVISPNTAGWTTSTEVVNPNKKDIKLLISFLISLRQTLLLGLLQ